MDQLKQTLTVLKKYHFWILCGVILLAYLGTWFMATRSMTKETETRGSKINSAFSQGNAIQSVTNHPNPRTVTMMEGLNRMEAEQVRKVWERRFRGQEDVLVWPTELKPDFIRVVERLIPIELAVEYPTPPQKELSPELLNRYRDYIREEMPKLAELIGAKWKAGSAAGGGGGYAGGGMGGMDGGMGGGMAGGMGGGMAGGMGGGMAGGMGGEGGYGGETGGYGGEAGGYGGMGGGAPVDEENPIIVEWSQQNQGQLQAASFNWVRPTTIQMLYAQEDLWILRSLMLVIKSTNGDADAQYNAAIKEIMSIDLGPVARGIKAVGKVKKGDAMPSGGSGEMGAGYGDMTGAMSGGEPGNPAGGTANPYGAGGGGAVGSNDPADNRYVDDKMEPLTGERLRTAMKTGSATDALLVVAKRMPVRLRLKMNVLKLPLFLCECANSDLPIEVRQVRINAPASTSGGFGDGGMGGGGGGRMPGSMGMGGATSAGGGATMAPGMGMGGGMEGGMGMGGSGGGEAGYGGMMEGGAGGPVESPFDATVEIYGLIYIYNPVNPAMLGLEDATATPASPDATTAPDAATDVGSAAPSVPATSAPAAAGPGTPATTGAPAAPGVPATTPATPPTTGAPGASAPAAGGAATPSPSGTGAAAAATPDAGATPAAAAASRNP